MSDWVAFLPGERLNIATGATLRWRFNGEKVPPSLEHRLWNPVTHELWLIHTYANEPAQRVWIASGGTM